MVYTFHDLLVLNSIGYRVHFFFFFYLEIVHLTVADINLNRKTKQLVVSMRVNMYAMNPFFLSQFGLWEAVFLFLFLEEGNARQIIGRRVWRMGFLSCCLLVSFLVHYHSRRDRLFSFRPELFCFFPSINYTPSHNPNTRGTVKQRTGGVLVLRFCGSGGIKVRK